MVKYRHSFSIKKNHPKDDQRIIKLGSIERNLIFLKITDYKGKFTSRPIFDWKKAESAEKKKKNSHQI